MRICTWIALPALLAVPPALAQPNGGSVGYVQTGAQGGSAPPDARDPHAYSGGTTLETGPYARPGPRELHLDDEGSIVTLMVERLEHRRSRDASAGTIDLKGSLGRDFDRLLLKFEGEHAGGRLVESRSEVLWAHGVSAFWDSQLGLRHDAGSGPGRNWLAVGVQGLAPYWFEVDATFYLGERGRSALRLQAEYELLLTQRLILQPRIEVSFHGRDDAARAIGSGASALWAGLRLRYELTRQFAPYIGLERSGKLGKTADFARAGGEAPWETRLVAGLRFWF